MSPPVPNIFTTDLPLLKFRSLCSAKPRAQKQLYQFINERLIPENKIKNFMDYLPKYKPLTCSSLYEIKVGNAVNTKKKGLKADRTVVQRLIMEY